MRLRDLTADDYVAYRTMTAGAFSGRFTDIEPQPFDPGETAIGIDSEELPGGVQGVLAAGARIRHDRITLGGGVARCGGIGGLAVHPAHRGGGVFRELLTGVIARCAGEGMALSMLYPSNPSIYRRLGYQVVASMQKLIVPLVDLQRLPAVPDRRLVPVTEETMPRLRAVYRELSAGDNAMLLREPPLFPETLPGDGWSALLLEDAEGTDHGYISWTRRGGEHDGVGLDVHEIFGRTRGDRIALLRSLGSWSTVTELTRLRVRTEDPVLDALPGGRLRPDPGVLPLVMMRVIDTAATLESRRAPAGLGGAVRLTVEDDTVPAGTCRSAGSWIVSAADGNITAVSAGSTDSAGATAAPSDSEVLGEVRLDIHAASLLLVGGRTVADARRLGLGLSADAPTERFLDALLAGPRPSVMDAF
ncbi:enhanced intracellular survival protein Eis [Brachybacterium sp. GCM10030267]|uniref:GNAT family N-acetyltransferase n=1 Tax=Brachybacterium sp. GCM10030267 TaxID=3273381 RepID=UPI00361909FA